MTKLNRLLIAALVLQLLILLVIQLVPRTRSGPKPRELFKGLDASKVAALRIEDNNKKQVELQRRGVSWVLKSGGDYPAQADKVTEFLGKLPGLTAGKPVATKQTHHRALEVADDKFQRKVAVKLEGGRSFEFLLGSSPGIKNVHLRMAGEKPVYLVHNLTAWDAGAMASEWVVTDYFKVDKDSVVSLQLKNPSGEIKLDKGPDGKWVLEGLEEGATLKAYEADSLVSSASSVALQEPVGKRVEDRFGLAGPQAAVLTLVSEQRGDKDKAAASQPATRVTHRLVIGVKEGDTYYAKSDGSDFVVRVASWAAESLVNKKPSDLWEKKSDKDKEKEEPGEAGAGG
jgi:hypothetical protein